MLRCALFLVVVAVLATVGCSSDPPAAEGPVQAYEVDGVLARLPEGPGTELMITHEEIPGFVNAEGDTVGMAAMTMGFPPAEEVSLEGFAPGDSVAIRFEVRWGQPKPLRLTHMEKR